MFYYFFSRPTWRTLPTSSRCRQWWERGARLCYSSGWPAVRSCYRYSGGGGGLHPLLHNAHPHPPTLSPKLPHFFYFTQSPLFPLSKSNTHHSFHPRSTFTLTSALRRNLKDFLGSWRLTVSPFQSLPNRPWRRLKWTGVFSCMPSYKIPTMLFI